MKTLIAGVVLIASLALTAEAAMAAGSAVHRKVAHVAHPYAAARGRYAPTGMNFDVQQFIQSMLGGPLPPQYARIVQDAMRESAHHRYARSSSGSSTYEPDNSPSPTVDNSWSAAQEQSLSDQENQINQENNDTAAMNASNAAAEQMNDAANAAATQTEINAGN